MKLLKFYQEKAIYNFGFICLKHFKTYYTYFKNKFKSTFLHKKYRIFYIL